MGLLLLAFFGVFFALTLKVLHDLDVNKVVYNHYPGKCEILAGIDNGSEDIVVLSSSAHALISSGVDMRFLAFATPSVAGTGNIFLYNFYDASNKAEKLEIVASSGWNRNEFFPLGLAVFEGSGTEKPLVYVINSKRFGELDVFELNVAGKSLKHLRTIKDPLFKGLNNIAVVGKDKFYVSNFYTLEQPMLSTAEIMLQLPLCNVIYYDGQKAHVAASGLKGPNGLVLSKDKTMLFVSLNPARELASFRIKTPSELELIEAKRLYTGIDNLNLDEEGNIWTASHPITYKAIQHMLKPTEAESPSQVLKITVNKSNQLGQVEEIFADDGKLLSASTVAAVKGNKLLIGTLFHKTLICNLS